MKRAPMNRAGPRPATGMIMFAIMGENNNTTVNMIIRIIIGTSTTAARGCWVISVKPRLQLPHDLRLSPDLGA